jgi:hypothetical protein
VQHTRDERSLGELFGELAQEIGELVRHEMALAKTELGQKASRVGRDVGLLAVGGLIGYAGFLVLLGAAVLLLALVVPLWLAALLVGLVTAAAGYVLVQRGLSALKEADLTPRRTVETLKEDFRWAKEQAA